MKLWDILVHLWISCEYSKITVAHCNFAKSYTLELQQNHGVGVILSNSLSIQTYTHFVNYVW